MHVIPLCLCVYVCSRLADILTSNCHFDNLLCAADAASTCCCRKAVLLAQPMHRIPVVESRTECSLPPAFPLRLKCFSISFNVRLSAQLPLDVRRSYSSQLNGRNRSCPFVLKAGVDYLLWRHSLVRLSSRKKHCSASDTRQCATCDELCVWKIGMHTVFRTKRK